MAVLPALTDFTFVEEKKGKMFVNSPNALEGNHISKCDTSDAKFQSEETGLIDGVGTEEEIIGKIRALVSLLPSNNEDNDAFVECTDDLNRVCEDIANCAGDTALALSRIADNGIFLEDKRRIRKKCGNRFYALKWSNCGRCCKQKRNL